MEGFRNFHIRNINIFNY